MLSTEELLKPRIKFIAPYPNSNKHFTHIGEIGIMVGSVNYEFPSGFYISKIYADTLTANFEKLQWWENRAIVDMPEYVAATSIISGKKGVFKIQWGLINGVWVHSEGDIDIFALHTDVLPATAQEFDDYTTNKLSEK